jgi:hypothetical protein
MYAIRDAVCALTAAGLLTACGGGGGGSGNGDSSNTNTATGVFKDANVSGLEYRSGDRSGTTGQNGEFTYEVGESVSFTIGGVTIGTADGAKVVTPVDLGSGNRFDAPDVVNRVRFLLFLDRDDDPDNGIQISDGVRDVAENWSQVDFASDDLENELTAIASDVASIDGDATVPDIAEAETHFSDTLRCLSSGAFAGDFSGGLEGRVAFFVQAVDGTVEGNGYVFETDNTFTLSSTSAVTLDTLRRFISGATSGSAEFNGRFERDGTVEGDWGGETRTTGQFVGGRFASQRIAGDLDAGYRFAATFESPGESGDQGVYAMDITDDRVTGTAFNTVTGATETITGRVVGGTEIEASTDNGHEISATLGVPLDSNAPAIALSGTWSAGGNDGTLTGDGCRLN